MNTLTLATSYFLFFSSLVYAQRELEVVYPYEVSSEIACVAILDRKDGAIYRHYSQSKGAGKTHFFRVTDSCSNSVVVFLDDPNQSLSTWSSIQTLKDSVTKVVVPDLFHVLSIRVSDECLRRIKIEKADAFFEVLDISSGSLNPYFRLTEPVNSGASSQKVIVNGLNSGRHMLLVRAKFNGVPLFAKEFIAPASSYTHEYMKANRGKELKESLSIQLDMSDYFSGITSYMSTFTEKRLRN